MQTGKRLNINVGLLGHVDSGKTSLAKALSTRSSTASFDKNPQSVERGITLDLGFSSFSMPSSTIDLYHVEELQFTLVDCPGHASLIRTIIGGSHIMDMMILLIDVNKGIQTQTAECIVLGQLTTKNLIVVLNKIDTLPEVTKERTIAKVSKRIRGALSRTPFADAQIIGFSANPSDGEPDKEELLAAILRCVRRLPKVERLQADFKEEISSDCSKDPFRFAIDHCFSLKGQGTVLTGTVLGGTVRVNDMIEFPALKIEKKVKSMQMFRQPVQQAVQGDRLGICVTQLQSKLIERGVAGSPGAYLEIKGAIICAERISFFKGPIKSRSRMHISIGHATVMATIQVFSLPCNETIPDNTTSDRFCFDNDYLYEEQLESSSEEKPPGSQFIFLSFDKKVICPASCMVIGSKLDTDIHANICRLAFSGTLLTSLEPEDLEALKSLKIYKPRQREGTIDRAVDERTVIGTKLFKKETDMSLFMGLQVIRTSNGAIGRIESSFGKSGKFKVYFPEGNQSGTEGELVLHYKKYIYNKQKKIIQ